MPIYSVLLKRWSKKKHVYYYGGKDKMTLGEYGVAATVGAGFDFLYLLVNGFVGNAGDISEVIIALVFIGMFASVVAITVGIVRSGIGGVNGALRDLGRMGR